MVIQPYNAELSICLRPPGQNFLDRIMTARQLGYFAAIHWIISVAFQPPVMHEHVRWLSKRARHRCYSFGLVPTLDKLLCAGIFNIFFFFDIKNLAIFIAPSNKILLFY